MGNHVELKGLKNPQWLFLETYFLGTRCQAPLDMHSSCLTDSLGIFISALSFGALAFGRSVATASIRPLTRSFLTRPLHGRKSTMSKDSGTASGTAWNWSWALAYLRTFRRQDRNQLRFSQFLSKAAVLQPSESNSKSTPNLMASACLNPWRQSKNRLILIKINATRCHSSSSTICWNRNHFNNSESPAWSTCY